MLQHTCKLLKSIFILLVRCQVHQYLATQEQTTHPSSPTSAVMNLAYRHYECILTTSILPEDKNILHVLSCLIKTCAVKDDWENSAEYNFTEQYSKLSTSESDTYSASLANSMNTDVISGSLTSDFHTFQHLHVPLTKMLEVISQSVKRRQKGRTWQVLFPNLAAIFVHDNMEPCYLSSTFLHRWLSQQHLEHQRRMRTVIQGHRDLLEVYKGSSGTVCLLVTFQFNNRIPANSKIFTHTSKYLYDPHSYQKNNHIKKHTHKTKHSL